jgi:hypothetical protein
MLMTAAEAWAFEAMVRCIVCCAAWAAHLVACRWRSFGHAQRELSWRMHGAQRAAIATLR